MVTLSSEGTRQQLVLSMFSPMSSVLNGSEVINVLVHMVWHASLGLYLVGAGRGVRVMLLEG